MKYTLLSWALVAFSALLTTALGSSDGRYMVVHNVNIAFDKSRRDIALVGFNVYNVLQGESFTCVTTKMPYYPMTPDFEPCKYIPKEGSNNERNKVDISFGVEPPTVRLKEDNTLDYQFSMLVKYKNPTNGEIWFARYKSSEETNELKEYDEHYILQPEAQVIEEYRGLPGFRTPTADLVDQLRAENNQD